MSEEGHRIQLTDSSRGHCQGHGAVNIQEKPKEKNLQPLPFFYFKILLVQIRVITAVNLRLSPIFTKKYREVPIKYRKCP